MQEDGDQHFSQLNWKVFWRLPSLGHFFSPKVIFPMPVIRIKIGLFAVAGVHLFTYCKFFFLYNVYCQEAYSPLQEQMASDNPVRIYGIIHQIGALRFSPKYKIILQFDSN